MTAGGWPRPAPAGLVGEHRAVPVGVEQFPLLLLRLRSGIRRTISRAVTRFFFGLEVNAVCSISAISAASISSQVAGSGIFHGYSIDACACRCPERVTAGPVTMWPVQFVIYAVVRPPGVPSTRNSLTCLPAMATPSTSRDVDGPKSGTVSTARAAQERVSHSRAAVPLAGQRIDDGLRDRMCGG